MPKSYFRFTAIWNSQISSKLIGVRFSCGGVGPVRDDLSCTLFFRTERIPAVLTVNSERGSKFKGFQFWVFPLLQDLLSAGCLTAHRRPKRT